MIGNVCVVVIYCYKIYGTYTGEYAYWEMGYAIGKLSTTLIGVFENFSLMTVIEPQRIRLVDVLAPIDY